jgi:hypothetical protein
MLVVGLKETYARVAAEFGDLTLRVEEAERRRAELRQEMRMLRAEIDRTNAAQPEPPKEP